MTLGMMIDRLHPVLSRRSDSGRVCEEGKISYWHYCILSTYLMDCTKSQRLP
jgi:hypothetical protein